MSPFELVNGYLPRTSFDQKSPKPTIALEELNQAKAKELAKRIYQAQTLGREAMEKAQEKNQRDANKTRRPVDFDVEDLVYILTKNWKT